MGLRPRRGRHGHVGLRNDPHDLWRRGHGDDARCLGHWLRKPYVLHVVGHDDRNDAALRSTDGPFVCGYEPQTKGER